MPGKRYEYELEISADTKGLDKAEAAAEDLEAALEGTGDSARDALRTLSAMTDDLEVELKGTASAADSLKAALGDAFDGDSARVEQYVQDLRAMGVEFDQIEANAKEFADVMERTDRIKLDATNSGLTSVARNTDGISDSARGANSALANMVGNSAQDVGELGGVAGSAGVALGQMAEYAADARFAGESLGSSLKSMAKVAGPIALIGGSVYAISQGFSLVSERVGASDKRVEALRENMEGLNVEAQELLATLQENQEALKLPEDVTVSWDDYVDVLQEIVHIGDGLTEINVAEVLDKANVSLTAFARTASADDLGEGLADFMGLLQQSLDEGLITTEEYDAALRVFVRTQDDVADAEREAAREAEAFASTLEDINSVMNQGRDAALAEAEAWNILVTDMADGALEAENAATAWNFLRDELGLTDDQIRETIQQKLDEKLEEDAAAAEEAADAAREHAEALGEMQTAVDDVARSLDQVANRGDAFAAAMARFRDAGELGQSQELIGFVDGLHGLRDAIEELDKAEDISDLDLVPDSWEEVLNMPEELRPVVDAIAGFADSVHTEMAQAFDAGGAQGVRDWSANTRQAIIDALPEGVTDEQVQEILGALGLLPEQVEIEIRLSNEDRARSVLDSIAGVIAGLPDYVQLRVAAIAEDDPIAALRTVVAEMQNAGIEVPVELELLLDDLQPDIEGLTPPPVTVPVEADTLPATKALDDIVADDRKVPIEADADTTDAERALDDTAKERSAPFAINILQLLVSKLLLDAVAAPRTATITADADTAIANVQLNNVARVRTAPIDGILRNFPSEQTLINHMTGGKGYLRIPVDTYPRNVARFGTAV